MASHGRPSPAVAGHGLPLLTIAGHRRLCADLASITWPWPVMASLGQPLLHDWPCLPMPAIGDHGRAWPRMVGAGGREAGACNHGAGSCQAGASATRFEVTTFGLGQNVLTCNLCFKHVFKPGLKSQHLARAKTF